MTIVIWFTSVTQQAQIKFDDISLHRVKEIIEDVRLNTHAFIDQSGFDHREYSLGYNLKCNILIRNKEFPLQQFTFLYLHKVNLYQLFHNIDLEFNPVFATNNINTYAYSNVAIAV